MAEFVTIQWLGHACFKVTADEYSIVLDPYCDDYVPGFGSLQVSANQVLCSHEHRDHSFTQAVAITPWQGECPWNITVIDSWHDDQQGALRGSNRIYRLDCGDFSVVHLGDLGCEPTVEQFQQIGQPTVLLIPVGGHYTIDAVKAKAIAARIKARVTVPMHYRGEGFGFDILTTVKEFTDLCDLTVTYDTDTIKVTRETSRQTAVLLKWNQQTTEETPCQT